MIRPNRALLDICLPDGNGLELTAAILADLPGVPVAVCTSYDLPEYREAAALIKAASAVRRVPALTALSSSLGLGAV